MKAFFKKLFAAFFRRKKHTAALNGEVIPAEESETGEITVENEAAEEFCADNGESDEANAEEFDEEITEAEKFCPCCGEKLEETDVFCQICGNNILQNQ